MIPRLPLLLSSFALSSATSIPRGSVAQQHAYQPISHIVHQFPDPTWVENIAVRHTGELLVSILSAPELHLINPLAASSNPTLLHDFSPYKGLTGITEVQPDHFYVVTSNVTLVPYNIAAGTDAVASVDLSCYDPIRKTGIKVKEVVKIPSAQALNGMTTLDAPKGLVIITDSVQGLIYVLNVHTAEYSILLQEPEMASASGGLGVNGVKVLPLHGTDTVYIYFDNTSKTLFCRVPLSLTTLKKVGPVETLETGYAADDFTLDPEEGVVYIANGGNNSINRIPLAGGKVTTVLGGLNQTIVGGPTSVALGRGRRDKGVKYITTNGGILQPIDGNITEGGRVVALVV